MIALFLLCLSGCAYGYWEHHAPKHNPLSIRMHAHGGLLPSKHNHTISQLLDKIDSTHLEGLDTELLQELYTPGEHKEEKQIHHLLDVIVGRIYDALLEYLNQGASRRLAFLKTKQKKYSDAEAVTAAAKTKLDDAKKDQTKKQNTHNKAVGERDVESKKQKIVKKALDTADGKVTTTKKNWDNAKIKEVSDKKKADTDYKNALKKEAKDSKKEARDYCKELGFVQELRVLVEDLSTEYKHKQTGSNWELYNPCKLCVDKGIDHCSAELLFPKEKIFSTGSWVKGQNGWACNRVCSNYKNGFVCDSGKQSKLTTNALVAAAFKEAGYTCKGFHPVRDYAGTPFSTARNDDCAPMIPGGNPSSCTANGYGHHSALCYCKSS